MKRTQTLALIRHCGGAVAALERSRDATETLEIRKFIVALQDELPGVRGGLRLEDPRGVRYLKVSGTPTVVRMDNGALHNAHQLLYPLEIVS
jgi:hypothetical protein